MTPPYKTAPPNLSALRTRCEVTHSRCAAAYTEPTIIVIFPPNLIDLSAWTSPD